MVPLGFLFGLVHGGLFPALMALLFEGVDPAARITLAGLANGLLHLGMMSVFLFGALANHTGFALVFESAGALVAASAIFLVPRAVPSKGPNAGL